MQPNVKTRTSQPAAVKGTASTVALWRRPRGNRQDFAREEAIFLIANARLEIPVNDCKQRMAAKSNRERIAILRTQNWLVSPAQQHRPGGISGAHGDQKHQIAFAEPLLLERIHQPKRNCGGGRVAEMVDVDEDLRIVHTQPLLHGANDSQIRLVRHDKSEGAARQAVAL